MAFLESTGAIFRISGDLLPAYRLELVTTQGGRVNGFGYLNSAKQAIVFWTKIPQPANPNISMLRYSIITAGSFAWQDIAVTSDKQFIFERATKFFHEA